MSPETPALFRMADTALPRVALPGVDPEEAAVAEALAAAGREANAERIRTGIRRALSLHRKGKHVYPGTVTAKVKARRRRANAIAKASRKANR